MKALAAQLCECEALLCWMVAEKQSLARGLVTDEPYLCPLLSFPGPFWLACVARTLDGGGAGVGGSRLGGGKVLLSLYIPSSLYIPLLPGFRMVATLLCCEWMKRLQRGSLWFAWIIMLDDS